MRNIDNQRDQSYPFGATCHSLHKGAIDLEDIERKGVQITQRRISGAKVINAELNLTLPQLLKHHTGKLRVLHDHTFSNLQLESLRIYLSIDQDLINLLY